MIVMDYREDAARIIIHDDCYKDKSKEEIDLIFAEIKKICTEIVTIHSFAANSNEK